MKQYVVGTTEGEGAERQAVLRPLQLTHGALEHTVLVPESAFFRAAELRDGFSRTVAPPAETTEDDEQAPLPTMELPALFLEYVTGQVNKERAEDAVVLTHVLGDFQRKFLLGNDIHAAVAPYSASPERMSAIVRSYYEALDCLDAEQPSTPQDPNLLHAAAQGQAKIYALFGGQGNTEDYVEELEDLYTTYRPLIQDLVASSDKLLKSLAASASSEGVYNQGLDILKWIREPSTRPAKSYLTAAPVSFPIIGLIHFIHYTVLAKALGKHPGQLRERFSGTTGHSQGIVTSVAVAASDSWDSFYDACTKALTILFWIGLRSQQGFPQTTLPPSMLEDSVNSGEGIPTPMLSIRGLSKSAVEAHVAATNSHHPEEKHAHVALINGPRNIVVSGHPAALYGLNVRLRKFKASPGLDQTRVPFSQRKIRFSSHFLPVSVPFHSKHLSGAEGHLHYDLQDTIFASADLGIPVYDTFTGEDIKSQGSANVVPSLVRMILRDQVDYPKATFFPEATHILDFGPGNVSGIGVLAQQNKDGTGVRVILAGTLAGSNPDVGYKPELLNRDRQQEVKYSVNWAKAFGPRLVSTEAGQTYVDTKMSRLLSLPPVMVAGMTPTTVCWDFVAATMNAGYHIELAGGGYFEPKSMEKAIRKVAATVTPGRRITCNLIYVNPAAIGWQVPLMARLRAEGVPIGGITIGAGVPSTEVANGYIRDLGLEHISFKPGSVDGIQGVVDIAKANPSFPVMLQWTGGRGGGHHSFEDFHQPILQMYSKIRQCDNIVLVAGSGFGGAEDSYPYLSGVWSEKFGFPPMPYDGVLFGSRVMTAKEAHTSKGSKMAIAAAPGVDDAEWERSYSGPTGGVLTVRSEMGEPIHKLATRGVKFWAEMDRKIFSLDKSKRVAELKKNKEYIIKKLNDDCQKVWFGKDSTGEAVDLEDMTYAEIVRRMVELMFVKHQSRWIDQSYRTLTGDFIRRVEERFTTTERPSLLQSYSELDDPFNTVEKIMSAYPKAQTQLVNAQDVQHFLLLSIRPGQKPVPFVPALDENFDFYFKKDSLWQSEDLDAVVGQDVGRVCILQGPVAVKHSNTIDQPIKEIMDSVHSGHIEMLLKDVYGGNKETIPVVEYFGSDKTMGTQQTGPKGFKCQVTPGMTFNDVDSLARHLAGDANSWRRAFFGSDVIVQGHSLVSSPFKQILALPQHLEVEIVSVDENSVSYKINDAVSGALQLAEVKRINEKDISLTLYAHGAPREVAPVTLDIQLEYHPENGFAPIREVTEGRNARITEFYRKLWFGNEKIPATSLTDVFESHYYVTDHDITDFVRIIGNNGDSFVKKPGKDLYAPMDFAIVVGWKAMMKPLFSEGIDSDLLKLVHLSNGFRMAPGAAPVKSGDVLDAKARCTSVMNQDAGKLVEVLAVITRDDKPIMDVTSRFLYRGDQFSDWSKTFEEKIETTMALPLETRKDVMVLQSQEWFQLDVVDMDLVGETLTFRLQSIIRFESKSVFSSVTTTGRVLLELPSKETIQVGSVEYEAGRSFSNPCIDYLQRKGRPIEEPVMFERPLPLTTVPVGFRTPNSNVKYAEISGDYNPIHVSPMFAGYAKLPGTITHGMYTSAVTRGLVETWAADNDIGRFQSFDCSFVGMVLPNDDIQVDMWHVGMMEGRKIIKVEAKNKATGEKVLDGRAEVDEPTSAYVFTGQGSQEQGMGMDLYASSAVARAVWDPADQYLLDNYGFSIIDIVRRNPKELTVHFGGQKGAAIRRNYIRMTIEMHGSDGQVKHEKLIKEIDEDTEYYTYRSPTGLLFSTQFAQPALVLMEIANFEDMRARGLVPKTSFFAGHSLGEYAALGSLAEFMPTENLATLVFYRGLSMQRSVERDETGRTMYSMASINPGRISKVFTEQSLRSVVDIIQGQTKWLLEIVNFNIVNQQYICAGDLRALDVLTQITNHMKAKPDHLQELTQFPLPNEARSYILELTRHYAGVTEAKPKPLELTRGAAALPLRGIDVPFHSSFLRPGVVPYRNFVSQHVRKTAIDPRKLIGKYIPNLTAKPFQITREYFEETYRLTNSPRIEKILANWDKYKVLEERNEQNEDFEERARGSNNRKFSVGGIV